MTRVRTGAAMTVAVVAASAALTAGSSAADPKLYSTMKGAKEVPGPGDKDGSGKATLTLKASKICFAVSWSKIGTAVAAHIHRGSSAKAGPVVFAIFGSAVSGSRVTNCSPASKTLIAQIKANPKGYYVNVHTAKFANGAIRGQLSKTAG